MRLWEKAKSLLKSGEIEQTIEEKCRRIHLKAIGMRLVEIYFIIFLIGGGFTWLCLGVASFAAKPCLVALGIFFFATLPAVIYFGVRFAGRLEEWASSLRSEADHLKSPFSRY
jgi:hypothetical protein